MLDVAANNDDDLQIKDNGVVNNSCGTERRSVEKGSKKAEKARRFK